MTPLHVVALLLASFPRTHAERKTLLETRPRQEIGEMIRATPPATLVEIGASAVRELGTYSARLRTEERVKGKMMAPKVMAITVRERPYAVRMEVVDGDKKGRKVLYNEELRKGEFRVREAGILGIKALWLDLGSGLARRDTNHSVTEIGFGPIMRNLAADLQKAVPAGGQKRQDEGFDSKGHWCLTFTAPEGAKDLYAQRTRMCLDVALALPVELEVHDRQGLLERVELTDVRPRITVPPDFFTLEAAGL
jgi:hypothetical protein